MRVTLDANILVYALQQGDERHAPAQAIVARAAGGDCIQTLQSFAECFNALVRKRKFSQEIARGRVDGLRARLPVAAAAPADLDRAIWATMTHRLAFWDAMLWATAERIGCSLLLTEDGHDGRKLDGATFVNPFAAHNRTLIDRALPPLEL
jgi:predicted nucleic acid-binding protein